MARSRVFSIRRRSRPGDAPGTLIAPAEARAPVIDVMSFNAEGFAEQANVEAGAIDGLRKPGSVAWVNLTGIGNAETLLEVGRIFGLHRLALEDVLNVHQRPKAEEYDDHLFVVVRMIANPASTETEQVSIFIGRDFVLSVQEKAGDCFEPVRERIRKGKGIVRSRGADYLGYTLIDAVVDAYFPALEGLGENLEHLENLILHEAAATAMSTLHDMKRELLNIRRAIWPHRELLSALLREENALLSRDTRVYLRDCYDHTIQLMDIVETYREIASDLVDVQISSVSAKLNEIMKVLTIIATIFIPLSFIASLYGMNFDRTASRWNMPELGWRFGYPLVVGLMAVCGVGMLAYFWRKGWLKQKSR